MLSCMALFDFASAFPSMSHQWLFLCMEACGCPQGIRNAAYVIYQDNKAFVNVKGIAIFIYDICSGVLQGCPLSGSLFVFGMDPLVVAFDMLVDSLSKGITRVCADDVGTSLVELKHLHIFYDLFAQIQCVSGLTLKPKKCILIITCLKVSIELKQVICSWLAEHTPGWESFDITNGGKYLGIWVGPITAKLQWEKAQEKYKFRCCEIAGVGASASISAKLYNMHAVPVLGYIAQFHEPPAILLDQERHCLHKVLHLPPNSLGKGELLSLPQLGGVSFSSIETLCAASLFRAGFCTFVWQRWYEQLQSCASESSPVIKWSTGILQPEGWDSNAIAANLKERTKGGRNKTPEAAANLMRSVIATMNPVGSPSGLIAEKIAVQKLVSNLLYPEMVCADFLGFFRRRISTAFQLELPDSFCPLRILKNMLEKETMHIRMLVIKTWCAGWTTSHRMPEVKLDCLFGCQGEKDNIAHYLRCPCLWKILDKILPNVSRLPMGPAPLLGIDGNTHNPLTRLGMIPPNQGAMHGLALAFSIYHAVKNQKSHLFAQAFESQDFSTIILSASNFSVMYANDLGILRALRPSGLRSLD